MPNDRYEFISWELTSEDGDATSGGGAPTDSLVKVFMGAAAGGIGGLNLAE
jgi:tetrahydromethanopterin S-methyltransferase subunit D